MNDFSTEDTKRKTSVAKELRRRFDFDDELARVFLGFAGVLILAASSSELWLTNDDSFFQRIQSLPEGLFPLVFLILVLIALYCVDWDIRTKQKQVIPMIAYAIACSFASFLAMSLAVFGVYFVIGELPIVPLTQSWKLLYLGATLSIGDFALSSAISRLLRRVEEMEEELERTEIAHKKLLERMKSSKRKSDDAKEGP